MSNDKIKEFFTCDLRSLAILRALLAVLIFINLRVSSDDGFILIAFSVFMYALSFLLLVGFQTRRVSFLIWLVIVLTKYVEGISVSVHSEFLNPYLFWSMFLPLGLMGSVDNALSTSSIENKEVYSKATIGVKLQTIIIFIVAIYLKLKPFLLFYPLALLLLIPNKYFIQQLEKLKTPDRLKLQIFYDGDCAFCKKMILIIKTLFLIPETVIKPAQEDSSILSDMEEHNSWVVVNANEERIYKFLAFIEIIKHSPGLFPLEKILKLNPVTKLGNFIYEKVASNRDKASLLTNRLSFIENKFEIPSYQDVFLLVVLIFIGVWNADILLNDGTKFPQDFKVLGLTLLLGQGIHLF